MNILFLGDSLIEYFDWQGRFPRHRVVNSGIAGESVQGLLSRVTRIKDVCSEADMVFIMSGINNVAMGDIGFPDFYRVILERLTAAYSDAEIFVSSLLPVTVGFIEDETIRSINASLIEIASETGARYLDLYSLFTDLEGQALSDLLLPDGVHLSSKGYKVWSAEVERVSSLV